MIQGTIIGTDALVARLENVQPRVLQSLEKTMNRVMSKLQAKVVTDKLSGQVLKVQTGTLRRSITNEVIAIEACSWGAFQVMGYHWARLGYPSAQAFRDEMSHSEGRQLDAFIRFIEADPALLKALKAKKWAEFARLYNGPAYKEYLYDAKLAAAFAKAERLAA